MWIALALLVAVGTSFQDILNKRATNTINPYVVMWGWWFFSLPFLAVGFFFQPMPPLDQTFWTVLAIDSAMLTVATIFYVKALNESDLSITVPMLSFTPMLMLITSQIMLGEVPSTHGALGVILIVVGSYVLNLHHTGSANTNNISHSRCGGGILKPFQRLVEEPGARYMLIVAVTFSIGANFDKIGVVHSTPLAWIFMLNAALVFYLTIFMMIKVNNWPLQLKSGWPALGVIGALNAGTYFLQLVTITMTLVPYLIAVKRMSVVFSALYGFLVLKEPGLKERFAGIGLMIAGVFLISFS